LWLWWALILAGVIVLAVWLARTLGQAPSGGSSYPRAESAEDVLRQRYARGEIDREEFQQRIDDLSRHGGASTAL